MIKLSLTIYRSSRGSKRVFRRCYFRAEIVNQIFVQRLDVSPFAVANTNCGSNLNEDSERENVYFSRYCYWCFGLFMKQDSFLLKHL